MTNENKHTPAPWKVFCTRPGSNNNDYTLEKPSNKKGYYKHVNISAEEREANAHLIAAAPELLEVLEQTFEDLKNGSYDENNVEPIINVIKKARGEA